MFVDTWLSCIISRQDRECYQDKAGIVIKTSYMSYLYKAKQGNISLLQSVVCVEGGVEGRVDKIRLRVTN